MPEWQQLNEKLFWYDVDEARRLLDEKKEERLTDWWRARIFRDYWKFTPEAFEVVAGWISGKPFLDDKLVALSLAFQLYVDGSRPRTWLNCLKKAVAGETELEDKLHLLLHPPALTEQEKRWRRSEGQYKRRQQQREEKETENHENWKRDLPNLLDQINNTKKPPEGKYWTARQYLFERMREFDQNSSKWAQTNWRDLIEDQSLEVAEAMREGLVSEWRNYKPKQISELGALNNSTPNLKIMALSGLEIEAQEQPDWPSGLSEEDAKLATQYIFSELNGFPTWLQKLFNKFPSIVLEVLGKEIAWDLYENPTEGDAHYVLSNLVWHAPWLNPAMAPFLLDLLKKKDPKQLNNLSHAISIILSAKNVGNTKVAELCATKLESQIPSEHVPNWFAAWVSVQPNKALARLEDYLNSQEPEAATKTAVAFINALYGGRTERGIGARESHKTPLHLKHLYLVMHKYICREDDIERSGGGVYSPTSRDDAQDARNRIFSDLLEIPGKDAFDALMDIAKHHRAGASEVWMRSHAIKRAELDAEENPWDVDLFAEFAKNMECRPQNHRQLFDLAVYRLQDLKSGLEESDTSTAQVVIKEREETALRNYFADWLHDKSRNLYSVPQEEEMPDAKRTDIRVHGAGIPGPIPIELKIADKWTGHQLFERLKNQLCGDYLRDVNSSNGIYFLVNRGEKKQWVHPSTAKRLDFEGLVSGLQEQAIKLIGELSNVENICIIGIDLTKRGFGSKGRKKKQQNK